jgi:hypothetical protein
MIYIKFVSYQEREYSPGVITYSYEVEFKIQNFRGAVTMGFNGAPDTATDLANYDLEIRLPVSPFTSNDTVRYTINTTKKIETGYMIDTLAEIISIPSTVANSYIDPRKFQRNGDTLDAVITMDSAKRDKLVEDLNNLDIHNSDEVEKYIKQVISNIGKNGAGGGTGICCPRVSVVI